MEGASATFNRYISSLLPHPMDISHLFGNEIWKMRPDVTTLVTKNDKHAL